MSAPTSMQCRTCLREFDAGERLCPHDGAELKPRVRPTDALIGKTIGGEYRIEDRLGHGGMGVVYKASQHSLQGRLVAVKLLAQHFAADPDAERRFRNEGLAGARLVHPHAVTVFQAGMTEDGTLYMVMELVEGSSLREWLRGGPLVLRDALTVTAQVAGALAQAHGLPERLIHRDIKPDNIIARRDSDGEPFAKVLDFGLALMEGEERLTSTGVRPGSVAYMAPEQLRDGSLVTDRTDVYALGITLYELLAGSVPFRSSDPKGVIHKHVNDPPPDLESARPNLPPEVPRLVSEMLLKDPTARPAASAVRSRLLAMLSKLPRTEVAAISFAETGALRMAENSQVASDPTRINPRRFEPTLAPLSESKEPTTIGHRTPPTGRRWVASAIGVILALAAVAGFALRLRGGGTPQIAAMDAVIPPQVKVAERPLPPPASSTVSGTSLASAMPPVHEADPTVPELHEAKPPPAPAEKPERSPIAAEKLGTPKPRRHPCTTAEVSARVIHGDSIDTDGKGVAWCPGPRPQDH